MNEDQIGGIIRAIVTSLGGAAVTQGLISGDQLTAIAGGLAALIGAAWSVYSNRHGHAAPPPK